MFSALWIYLIEFQVHNIKYIFNLIVHNIKVCFLRKSGLMGVAWVWTCPKHFLNWKTDQITCMANKGEIPVSLLLSGVMGVAVVETGKGRALDRAAPTEEVISSHTSHRIASPLKCDIKMNVCLFIYLLWKRFLLKTNSGLWWWMPMPLCIGFDWLTCFF